MDRELQAEATISDHVIYAAGGAALPVPLLDIAAVTAVQLDLVRDLAAIYDVDHDVMSSRTLVTSLVGASLPRVGASLVKALPGAGWLAGALAQVALSGASTWAVGQLFRRLFASGRTLASVQVEEVRSLYDDLVEEGREVGAGDSERVPLEPMHEDRRGRNGNERARLRGLARALARLERMRASGAINETEFERLKTVALTGL